LFFFSPFLGGARPEHKRLSSADLAAHRQKAPHETPGIYVQLKQPLVSLFVCLFVRSSVRLCSFLFVCLFVRSFVCSFVRLFLRSFVRLFVRSSVCLFVRLFVCSFVRSFVYVFLVPFVVLRAGLSCFSLVWCGSVWLGSSSPPRAGRTAAGQRPQRPPLRR